MNGFLTIWPKRCTIQYMKAFVCAWFFAIVAFASGCISGPEVAPEQQDAAVVATDTQPGATMDDPLADTSFDGFSVSAEVKQSTMVDVQSFVEQLNRIIASRNYDEWTKHLTPDYLAHYSNPEVLAEISQDPALKRYSLVLRTLRDYFNYVVFPSRRDSQVDDIEFLDKSRIKVIWISPKGEPLVLYNLEKIGDTWKIAIWR